VLWQEPDADGRRVCAVCFFPRSCHGRNCSPLGNTRQSREVAK
jgi:hypothetical protein